ncbi:MAG: restriction endonuclease subunit S [Desulfobulbus sp.]|nr:restriction endonuclease subunit S [Desulfobulbus sp.]
MMILNGLPEGWRDIRLGECLRAVNGGTSVISEERVAFDGELRILKTSAVSKGVYLPSENKALTESAATTLSVSPLAGCILFNRKNTPELVGTSAYIENDEPKTFLPDLLWQLHVCAEDRFHARWLSYVLSAQRTQSEIRKRANGTSESMMNITKPSLCSIHIPCPPFIEQKKIANLLIGWDRAIELTERLIAEKRLCRRGLMQQLLTGKRRLPGFRKTQKNRSTKWGDYPVEWGYPRIGEVAKHVSITNKEGDSLPVLSCTKHQGLVDSLEYFGKQIFSKDLSTYKVVRRGQFAYATNHLEEGSIGYQNIHDAALISPMYTVFEAGENIDDRFLFLLLKTELYRHIFQVNTSASVDRRGSLRWPEFSHLHVPLPSLDEQRAIVKVIKVADRELDLLRAKANALREQKKGLMQQLLTGKKRVKV